MKGCHSHGLIYTLFGRAFAWTQKENVRRRSLQELQAILLTHTTVLAQLG